MISYILAFTGIFISSLIYLFSMKKFNTYFVTVLHKEKLYYSQIEPPKEDEVDYTAQVNYFNKVVSTFITLTSLLALTVSWTFKFLN